MTLFTFPVLMFQLAIVLSILLAPPPIRPLVSFGWVVWTFGSVWFLSPLMFLQFATIAFCYFAFASPPSERAKQNGRDIQFNGDGLKNADLRGEDLVNANLNKKNLRGANLMNANLTGAKLIDANLARVILTDANLSGAKLVRTLLVNANLRGANLTNANLTGANLRGANLMNANLTGANLYGTDSVGAKFIHTTMPDGSVRE